MVQGRGTWSSRSGLGRNLLIVRRAHPCRRSHRDWPHSWRRVEGWARGCGVPCLLRSAPPVIHGVPVDLRQLGVGVACAELLHRVPHELLVAAHVGGEARQLILAAGEYQSAPHSCLSQCTLLCVPRKQGRLGQQFAVLHFAGVGGCGKALGNAYPPCRALRSPLNNWKVEYGRRSTTFSSRPSGSSGRARTCRPFHPATPPLLPRLTA